MTKLETHSRSNRKARTRSMIQLAGLMEKAGLLETFGLILGRDFQKDPEMKESITALYKGLLVLNELAQSEEVHLPLWAQQGLEKMVNLQKK